jgi:hypothetical protein
LEVLFSDVDNVNLHAVVPLISSKKRYYEANNENLQSFSLALAPYPR